MPSVFLTPTLPVTLRTSSPNQPLSPSVRLSVRPFILALLVFRRSAWFVRKEWLLQLPLLVLQGCPSFYVFPLPHYLTSPSLLCLYASLPCFPRPFSRSVQDKWVTACISGVVCMQKILHFLSLILPCIRLHLCPYLHTCIHVSPFILTLF